MRRGFQSTLPRGERPFVNYIISLSVQFQSTLPRGERRCSRALTRRAHHYFNPRSHEGSDLQEPELHFLLRDFNPRSHEGSDQDRRVHDLDGQISIHAPTRGATAILAKNSLSFSAKNHKTIFLQPNCSFSICSFSKKLRYLCIFQSANPSIISCPLPIRAFALLHNQSIVYCNSSVDTYVLYFCLILISQIIKSQTINTLINSVC